MQPYQPMGPGPVPGQPGPYAYPYPAMPPSGPRTLGTLSIIFGSIVAALSFFGAIGGAGMATMMMRGLPENTGVSAMHDYLDAIRVPSLIQSLVLVGMSVWLIFLGLGQRRYRAWAARQSVVWGAVALAVLVGMFLMAVLVTGPAAERMMEAMAAHSGVRNPMGAFTRVAGILGVLFYLPYPIILIVAFRKPATIAAMNT